MATSFDNILKTIEADMASAKTANLMRYNQAMAIYDEIINRYQPGGTYGKAALGELEKQKVRDVGREQQSLISSGMAGTTTMGGVPQKWEAEVGAPSRLKLEDLMMERLSQAQAGKAEFITAREDVGPSYQDLLALGQAKASAGGKTTPTQMNVISGGGSPYAERPWNYATSGETPAPATTAGGGGTSYTDLMSGTVSGAPSTVAGGTTSRLGITGIGGSYQSTMPKGTGTISGPKGTTTIGGGTNLTAMQAELDKYLSWQGLSATQLYAQHNMTKAQLTDSIARYQKDIQAQQYQGGWTG